MVAHLMKEELKCVTMVHGVRFVMMLLVEMMLQWLVDSSDFLRGVRE